jgi:Tol biopolymer transport system component
MQLVPFDGSSLGQPVGPRGTCTVAAWSPDGKWMYFGVTVGASSHLWRQKFPNGKPQQITFGPGEEEGVALAPDGRSLVTSVGARRSAIWIHDSTGERAISSEGYAVAPRFSRDGSHVFYLSAKDLALSGEFGWMTLSGELRSVELSTGKTDVVLPGVAIKDYDISPDEKELAFTALEPDGETVIWLSSVDRRRAPHQVTRSGDQVSFGADGKLVFRSLEETTNWLAQIKKEGGQRERIASAPILDKFATSPDGKWVVIGSPGKGQDAPFEMLLVPTNGAAPKKLCVQHCAAGWSSDGRFFYAARNVHEFASTPGKRLIIPVPVGKSLPDLPVGGIDLAGGENAIRGARVIERGSFFTGPDPAIFAFTKTDLQRNLFRIPLH